ncbi:hypothetical protein K7X08_029135 [Anisodus acutangulus]|uniref:F-box domain-containing protein n=1 Tax=Anisodus acutangulus TaxID=402998 RepID=A0A9Q1L3Q7_9SOLA|nr:hypothetical protein K7X08_029135 [Anisodus acutangulus]
MSINKIRCRESPAADRISSLPCHVLEKILGCLPLRDAIRTKVLSKQWSYKWVVRSELAFDKANIDGGLLKTIIYQVLLIHQGPLRKFSFCVPNSDFLPDISYWIRILLKKNVQEFSLKFPHRTDFRVPFHLFKFEDLRHLELCSCKLHPPPDFKAFSRLVTLNFRFVTFEPTSFQTFLSSSPLLERVVLFNCSTFDSFIVDASNLKSFEFTGSTKSICFINTPLLEEIIMGLFYVDISKFFAVPEPQVTLHNIKQLNFKFFKLAQWAAYALHLISNCPNLERLHFIFCEYIPYKDVVEHFIHQLRSQGMPHSALKQLKRLDIKLTLFLELEIELVKYVLSSAPALEIICISASAQFSQGGMKMMEEMKQFAQSSSNLEFIYKGLDHIDYYNN